MHDRRTKAAHDPGRKTRVGNQAQQEDVAVLHQSKTRSNGEAENGRIDQKADPARADEKYHNRPLQRLFDDGGHVARKVREVDVDEPERGLVDEVAHHGGRRTAGDEGDHALQLHEFVAVEREECAEEAQYGQQSDQQNRRGGERHGCERSV